MRERSQSCPSYQAFVRTAGGNRVSDTRGTGCLWLTLVVLLGACVLFRADVTVDVERVLWTREGVVFVDER